MVAEWAKEAPPSPDSFTPDTGRVPRGAVPSRGSPLPWWVTGRCILDTDGYDGVKLTRL